MSVRMSIHMCAHMPICLFAHMSIRMFVRMAIRMCVRMYMCRKSDASLNVHMCQNVYRHVCRHVCRHEGRFGALSRMAFWITLWASLSDGIVTPFTEVIDHPTCASIFVINMS